MAVYIRTIDVPFLYDDKEILLRSQAYEKASYIRDIFTEKYFDRFGERTYRPVMTLSFFADRFLWNDNVRGYHAVNISLHLLAALAVMWVLSLIGISPFWSFFGGLLFALHPIQTEPVILASNREELLCGLFYFLALALYLRNSRATYTLSVLCFILSIFSKEMAASFPLVIVAADIYFVPAGESVFRVIARKWKKYIPYFAGVALLLILRYTAFDNQKGAAEYPGGSVWAAVLTMSHVYFKYIRLLILPVRQCADQYAPVLRSLSDPVAAASLAGIAVYVILMMFFRARAKTAGFALAFFALTFLPVSNVIPFGETMAERYMYIPSFALVLLLAAVFDKIRFAVPKYAVATAVVCLLTILTMRRSAVWQSDLSLWSDTLSCNPKSGEAHINLANEYLRRGMAENAILLYLEVPKLGDKYDCGKYYYNLGLAYDTAGNRKEAMKAFEGKARCNPDDPEPYYYFGKYYGEMGRPGEGLKMLEKAVSIDPDRALSYYIEARFITEYYKDGKDLYNAVELLEKAAELDPESSFEGALGDVYLRLGRLKDAENALLVSIKKQPDPTSGSYKLLIHLYEQTGRSDKAVEIKKKMLAHTTGN
jgi:protein O-mannosyl-transferase